MPVSTSFQVDIDINEDKLGQSGDRILSTHIKKIIMTKILTSRNRLELVFISCQPVGQFEAVFR